MSFSTRMLFSFTIFLCPLFVVGSDDDVVNREELLAITRNYVMEKFPRSVSSLELPMIVCDHDDYWEVTFKLPDQTLGGVPVVHISKDSKAVIKGYHTQ